MGCNGSTEAEKGKPRASDDPELIGKAKFLSCPSMSEIVDATQTKWLIMVFAPLTHHGLIFAARNAKDGSLLVKDIEDKQVAKEKDDQKVQLSYNLFFKAISTEVAKANRSGAKVEWLADGTMSVECKIAISGSTSSTKKADTYTAVLTPIEPTDANLFKYILEPLATHYTKKRTDGWNLDRPDPHKEKLYGEQESNAILRAASMRSSQKVLDLELPNIAPLRTEFATSRSERDAAVAKVNLLKQMLAGTTLNPPILSIPPDDAFEACSTTIGKFNRIASGQDPHIAYPTPNDALLSAGQDHDAPKVDDIDLQLAAWKKFEVPVVDTPLLSVGLAAFKSLKLIGPSLTEDAVILFLFRVDRLHRRFNAFHNARRAAERMHVFTVLVHTAMTQEGFEPSPEVLLSALIAAAIHDVDHCGLHNSHGSNSVQGGYIPTLYNFDSQVERHSLAVGICEALNANLKFPSEAVAAIVLATDLGKHQEFMLRFSRRAREVADFSRRQDDQILIFSAMLKTADLVHLYKTKDACSQAVADLATELRLADTVAGIDSPTVGGSVVELDAFVTHVAKPLFSVLAFAFPHLSFVVDSCNANFLLTDQKSSKTV